MVRCLLSSAAGAGVGGRGAPSSPATVDSDLPHPNLAPKRQGSTPSPEGLRFKDNYTNVALEFEVCTEALRTVSPNTTMQGYLYRCNSPTPTSPAGRWGKCITVFEADFPALKQQERVLMKARYNGITLVDTKLQEKEIISGFPFLK